MTLHHILIVDDNRDGADTLAILLGLLGHRTEVAYGGPEAIEAIRRTAPDVVILDIHMPEIDGYAVARSIRSDANLPRTVLIALTALARPQDKTMAKAAGFDFHLQKPADLDDIGDLVASIPANDRR